MKTKSRLVDIFYLYLFGLLLMGLSPMVGAAVAPTEEREWTSVAGTKVQGVVLSVAGENARLRKPDGSEIVVPLAKFVPEDRAFLEHHFRAASAPATPTPPTSAGKSVPLAAPLAHPSGQVSGPHDAGKGSHYFIYIPNSLKEKRGAPLLFYTGSIGGTASHVKAHIKGAEINGWIVAASVESKNKSGLEKNLEHTENCLEHLTKILPIDRDRLYFTGSSGGGALAFENAVRHRAAGAMPIIGYMTDEKPAKGTHYYVLGGATDFNRYHCATAAEAAGPRGFHRIYAGGHSDPQPWIRDEAMTWLNGRYLETKKADRKFDDERLDWEAAMLAWLNELKVETPYRAYYWCQFLRNIYEISGTNAAAVVAIATELARDPINVRYAEGIDEINAFSKRYLSEDSLGSSFSHTTPKIQSAAARLKEKYAGVPHIEEVAKHLGYATAKK